jgi:hypothetical protein
VNAAALAKAPLPLAPATRSKTHLLRRLNDAPAEASPARSAERTDATVLRAHFEGLVRWSAPSSARSLAARWPRTSDVEVDLDLIYGPFHHRLLHGHAALTDRFAASVIDLALAGILRVPPAVEVCADDRAPPHDPPPPKAWASSSCRSE